MSRITRGRVEVGESVSAPTLNNTYNDYSQAGALNGYNTRDQAFDLPHFSNNVKLILNTQLNQLIGNGEKAHPASTGVAVPALTSGTAVHVVEDGAGTPTFLNWSSDPWVINAGEYLRVWWRLSMFTDRSGFTALALNALGKYTVPEATSGSIQLTDSFHCWVAYLQWDVTSAALTNWEPVTAQMDPGTNIDGAGGNGFYLYNMNGATVISPWTYTSLGFADEGKVPSGQNSNVFDHEWFCPYGMFVHQQKTGSKTVYGVRLVILGLLHPAHVVGGNAQNILLLDYITGADQQLLYTSGCMAAIHGKMD